MRRLLMLLAVGLLGVAAAHAQDPGSCREGGACSCDAIVDRQGNLNAAHCDAWRVMEILGRYADRSARLLPELAGPSDLEAAQRKLEQFRREAVNGLLTIMTREELQRFLPVLTGSKGGGGLTPGNWPGGPLSDCDKEMFWINQAIFEMQHQVDPIIIQLQYELNNFPYPDPTSPMPNPYIMCDPSVVNASPAYLTANIMLSETRQWLQLAANAMSNGMPAVAALDSFIAWWRAFQAGFGFVIAYSWAPINNDARCSEISAAGLALGAVAGAAKQGYEWGQKCAGSGGFFF